jgi:uncharacterized 2Fe-2S/4Fe-4S cluster protein (DUF4445 family)
MASYQIEFEPVGRRGECAEGITLLDCANRLGVDILSICGGFGICRLCRVQILYGTVSPPTSRDEDTFSPEELQQVWRLACQTFPASDCRVYIPPESMSSPQRTQVEGLEVTVQPDPPVLSYEVTMTPPTLEDLRADDKRLLEALNRQHNLNCNTIDIDVLRGISVQLRSFNWHCQVAVRNKEIVALNPWPGRHLGLAVDLGTTKIAGYLVDLNSGQTLAAKGVMNPQISYGEDIISRITRTIDAPAEAKRLQELATGAINQLAGELCGQINANLAEIVDSVVVGNTAMHHLLLGLSVKQLAYSPFTPAVSQAIGIKARDAGLKIAPGAYVYLLPNIAGFVGADHMAVLVAIGAADKQGLTLAIDIGTNTEVSLIDNGNISSVSCASGPAFEGGHISCGMRAASGAIERLRIINSGIQYHTIDSAPPVGVCGSGILDVLAQFYLTKVVDKAGRLDRNHPRVFQQGKQRAFLLVSAAEWEGRPAIAVTQQDIRELQLAKSAIRSGIQVLLEENGRSEDEIDQVIIAGAFGNYIDIESAITIGMLPALPLNRFIQVGNAAGSGARLALISKAKRTEAEKLASNISYIELATNPNFMATFIEANYLGIYRFRQGKRGEIDADQNR